MSRYKVMVVPRRKGLKKMAKALQKAFDEASNQSLDVLHVQYVEKEGYTVVLQSPEYALSVEDDALSDNYVLANSTMACMTTWAAHNGHKNYDAAKSALRSAYASVGPNELGGIREDLERFLVVHSRTCTNADCNYTTRVPQLVGALKELEQEKLQ